MEDTFPGFKELRKELQDNFNKQHGIKDENDLINFYNNSSTNIKLYYPEPFIASPTEIHEDLFFLHMFHYMY
jgi:hypothetical protein